MTNEEQILQNTEEILSILKTEFNIETETETPTETETTEYMQTLTNSLKEGSFEEIIENLKQVLTSNDAYSEEDVLIKIFTDTIGNTILEIKIKPYPKWGKTIDWLFTNLGEPENIETSRYTMKLIMWYNLTKYQQISEEETPINDEG